MRIDIKDNVIIYGFDEEPNAEERVSSLFEEVEYLRRVHSNKDKTVTHKEENVVNPNEA